MKFYNHTTSSMKESKLSISRRHFVASASATPVAFGAMSALAPSIAQADVMKILENDKVLGDTSAPIAIVEYASLTCGHCANFHNNIFPSLQKDYIDTGKAYLIYRDYPLDQYAYKAAILAHTAGDKRFFAALKILFTKQNEWTSAGNIDEALMGIAKMLGIPAAKFEAALKDEKLGESILMDRMVGSNEYGVSGTPTLFINGELFREDWADYSVLDGYLKGLL